MSTLLFQLKALDVIAGAVLGLAGAAGIAWLWSRLRAPGEPCKVLQVTRSSSSSSSPVVYTTASRARRSRRFANAKRHEATEIYGPQGEYGQLLTYLLVGLPLAWLAISWALRP